MRQMSPIWFKINKIAKTAGFFLSAQAEIA